MSPQSPLPLVKAWIAVARCVGTTAGLLARRRIHQPRTHVDEWLHFADGTSARVYRETVVDRPPATEPTVLVVAFRLRGIRGRGHVLFRLESMAPTPRSSSGSTGSSRSCGWPTTTGEPTAGCTNGTAPAWPRHTRGRCGGCWPWSASRGRSATTSSSACTAMSCCRTRRRSALKGERTGGG